jgi:transcriptional regulator with XRE-family HTH domain
MNKQTSINNFSDKFYQALKSKNLERLTNDELSKIFDVSDVIVYKWLNNKAIPSIARIPIIANKLGVSVEYLLGLETEQNTTTHEQLLHYFDKLNDEQQQLVMSLTKNFNYYKLAKQEK